MNASNGKRRKTKTTAVESGNPGGASRSRLRGFDWLDRTPSIRCWFAKWLSSHWRMIYRDALRQLHTKEDFAAYSRMEETAKKLTGKAALLTTAGQIAVLHDEAIKLKFKTSRERIEEELRYFLTRAGKQQEHAEAFKASPWCNHFAVQKHILERAGKDLPYKVYADDPEARLLLENVIAEFGSLEIWRTTSPTLRERRIQRALYFAVQRLCRPEGGVKKLAEFIHKVLRDWPMRPAGMEFDIERYFDADRRSTLVSGHLSLAGERGNKESRALYRVLGAIIGRDELRESLLGLAHTARLGAEKRLKGWQHLRRGLGIVFDHIARRPSDEEMFRNFERSNFPWMRNLTREQRMRLLPEMGNDADQSVRDLTKSERMTLAARIIPRTRKPMERDADGKNSFATRYGRAMRIVKKELGDS
jgi:hypothetical protein